MKLVGDEYVADPDFQASYANLVKRWVSQVFIDDGQALQRIGPDPMYPNEPYANNLYANTSWAPSMRHSWSPRNTLQQWQERFGEDQHSKLMPVAFEARGTAARLR